MATLADSLVSATARKLTLRKRPDLASRKHRYQGQVYWVVKDPVGLNYFRFQEEEFFILEALDGTVSLNDLKDRFEAEFPPQKITVEELQQFIGTLHRSGLIIANVPGQGHQLKKRRDDRVRKQLLGTLTNILCIRFKGIDPDRLLEWIYPLFRWVFRPWAVAAWVTLVLSAGLLLLVEFEEFRSKLPTFHQFFTIENAVWLAVAMGVTKVIHEFGHGLSCKHFGGECHEMGVMVLVLTPCLYCNVSDSWMLPNKWHRAAIGAAGMYVELAIASICTFIWWFSEPGMLNHLCLSTMFVSSVSTVMFNGNPLLRYDGYYILSDVLEIPNLRQKASDILNRKLAWWCLGIEQPDDPFLPRRNQMLFALYSVAAVIYRWIVTFSILYFLYKVWEPYRLEVIGQLIAAMSIYGLVAQPAWAVGKFFWLPGRIEKVKKTRMFATLGLLAAAVLAVIFVPLPYRVFCPVQIKLHDPSMVYVTVPGVLEEVYVQPGDEVAQGAKLAQLTNYDLDLEIARYEGEIAQRTAELAILRGRTIFNDRGSSELIAGKQETLAALEQQLRDRKRDREKLTLHAEVSGTVMPPPEVATRPDPEQHLVAWSGTPMERNNRGSYLMEGTTFCLIGDPHQMEATLVVDQADRNFIADGQSVDIQLVQLSSKIFHGRIDEISSREMTQAPKQLSNKGGGSLPTKTDESGIERPLSTSYPARVLLDNHDDLLRIGLTGQAKIYAGTQTLGQRIWRYLARTFNFRL